MFKGSLAIINPAAGPSMIEIIDNLVKKMYYKKDL